MGAMKTMKTLTAVAVILGVASVLSLGATTIISNMPKALATTEAFVATLSGDREVPPVETQATGTAGFSQPHLNNMTYGIQVNNIEGVTGSTHTPGERRSEWTYNRNTVQS